MHTKFEDDLQLEQIIEELDSAEERRVGIFETEENGQCVIFAKVNFHTMNTKNK